MLLQFIASSPLVARVSRSPESSFRPDGFGCTAPADGSSSSNRVKSFVDSGLLGENVAPNRMKIAHRPGISGSSKLSQLICWSLLHKFSAEVNRAAEMATVSGHCEAHRNGEESLTAHASQNGDQTRSRRHLPRSVHFSHHSMQSSIASRRSEGKRARKRGEPVG